jgi:hypothetical protein
MGALLPTNKGSKMKQLKVFGMAIALVCVLSAAAAATAGASQIKYTGSGKFSISSPEGTLETVGGVQVVCKSDEGSGHLGASPATTASLTVLFKECASVGKKCTTTGQTTGNIVTNLLTATFIKEGSLVLVLLKPETGTAFLSNTKCGTLAFEAVGSLLGVLTPQSTKTTKLTATFKQTSGVQEQREVGGVKNVLTATLNGEVEQAGLASVETLTLLEGGEGTLEP